MTAFDPPFRRLALVGLGLIGSSIAWGAKKHGLASHIAGYARSAETRKTALELGFLDSVHESAAAAAEGADCVIVCVPVGATGEVVAQIRDALQPGAILSDVGSTKTSVIAQATPHVPQGVHFIPSHPLAGTEHSGPSAGFAELFEGRWCIFTPLAGTDEAALTRLTAFWQALGSEVDLMDAEHHDRVLAITSHLPHLIAYTTVGTASDLEEVTKREVIKYSASGFRDFTRIAASDPVMWRDVFLHNREATLELLGRFTEELIALQRAIRWGDGAQLEQYFARTREIRRAIIDAGQDTAAPDFGRNAAPQGDSSAADG